MKERLEQWRQRLADFHHDEAGEQNMSTVMLLGVGALVVVGLIGIGVFIFNYASTSMEDATQDPGFQTPGGGAGGS
ncbi:MAG: hypothetical protein RIC55_23000 [Pirellulaceae bacterium]